MTEFVTLEGLDWAEFDSQYWDQRPVLIRGVRPVPFVAEEVFASAVRAHQAEYGGHRSPTAQFTVEQTRQGDPDKLLPDLEEGSFDVYEDRLAQLLDGRRYALVVHSFHAFDRPLWERERQFFRGLWDQVGLPLTGAITTLFHGNYDHSPVGVHKDRFATFMFGLRGRKRMRFWTERPWQDEVSTMVDYQRYLPSSFTVDVEPGDLLYWPCDYYHVGENRGETPTTSVNIGVPRIGHKIEYELQDLLADPRSRLLAEPPPLLTGGIDAPAHAMPAAGELANGVLRPILPAALSQALSNWRSQTPADQVEEVSRRRWAAGGFEPVPPGAL